MQLLKSNFKIKIIILRDTLQINNYAFIIWTESDVGLRVREYLTPDTQKIIDVNNE